MKAKRSRKAWALVFWVVGIPVPLLPLAICPTLIFYNRLMGLRHTIFLMEWEPNLHNDVENLRWAWLRAVEWGAYPIFISQIIFPVLIFFWNWKIVLLCLIGLNWLWNLIKYNYQNLRILTFYAALVPVLKYVFSVGFGIYFLVHKQYLLMGFCILYPIIGAGIIGAINYPTQIGTIQNNIMKKMGYEKNQIGEYQRNGFG